MLDAGKPVKIPDVISTFVAVLCVDKAGMCASVRAAKTLYGSCSLIILDFEAGPLHHERAKRADGLRPVCNAAAETGPSRLSPRVLLRVARSMAVWRLRLSTGVCLNCSYWRRRDGYIAAL